MGYFLSLCSTREEGKPTLESKPKRGVLTWVTTSVGLDGEATKTGLGLTTEKRRLQDWTHITVPQMMPN